MFSYLGSKANVAHLYPAPRKGSRVFEPFAGSARYALLHPDHEVWLNDIDPMIYRIWRYIQQATRKDIESLPELRAGEDLRQFKWLSDAERELIGMQLGYPHPSPSYICSPHSGIKERCRYLKKRILDNQRYVRHWRITNLHYLDLPNEEGTWFVDPPYQHARCQYRYNCVLDYARLARWCRSRNGQVIVCEGHGADWLPFRPLVKQWTQRRFFQEMVWVKGIDELWHREGQAVAGDSGGRHRVHRRQEPR